MLIRETWREGSANSNLNGFECDIVHGSGTAGSVNHGGLVKL